ncbi:two-component system QseEF-associated lipoprotein QseG [Erwinia sp. V71]|uniref:two-component system QseEF-associated lipoprotein QseG n=1 Tax=Erwinia sp. V71 TaxID=3369424 RepID=UPI003F60743D
MKRPFLSALSGRIAVTLLPLLLAACSHSVHQASAGSRQNALMLEPELKIINYPAVSCEQIWQLEDDSSLTSPLYWLRAMDCATRLSAAEARAEARQWPAENWQNTLKQGILLNNGNVTPVERRQYMTRIDGFVFDYPAPVRPLLQLWRDNQMAELQLSQERTRYAQLQESSDNQLDALRERQRLLTRELADTRRKLENLTDIERQLSSRKSPDVSDNGQHGNSKTPAAAEGSPDTTEDANP